MKADYLSIIEAAYAIGQPLPEWLAGISAAAHPVLERGLGVYAFCYDASDPAKLSVSLPVGSAIASQDAAETFLKLGAALAAHPEAVKRMYCAGPPIAFARDLGKVEHAPTAAAQLPKLGWTDAMRIRGQAPPARGAMLVVPIRERPPLPPRLRGTLNHIATHLAASFRLRELRAQRLEDSDALFGAKGELLHVSDSPEGAPGIPTLRAGVQRMLDGRKFRREDSQRSVELWRALIAGRWSVFERFDTDGRRFLVARRNEPQVTDPRKLSYVERCVALYASWGHSQKLMSYELGLSQAAISQHLRGALRKLGLKHRGELAGLFDSQPPKAPDER